MGKIKAIFIDFDWTLFDHDTRSFIKEANDAINLVHKQGVKIFINSARAYYSLLGLDTFKHINFDGYCVSNGGAAFTDSDVIYAHYIPTSDVKKLIKIAKNNKINYLFSTLKDTYIKIFNYDDDMVRFYQDFYEPFPMDIKEYNGKDKITAIQFFMKDDKDYLLDEFKGKLRIGRFSKYATEINAKKLSKSESIIEVANFFNIPLHNIAAFGDGDNDIDMFDTVKYGICLANGDPEAKKHAKYVAPRINKGGIVDGLKYLKLIK